MAGKTARSNSHRKGKFTLQPARAIKHKRVKLERRLRELTKRYPECVYEIKDGNIVRVKGRRPHKVSKKARS